MAATYTYSLSADFGNQICVSTLTTEIEAAIATPLSFITVSPTASDDYVNIVFTSSLTGGELTTLDGVVVAHDGSVCPEPDENYRTYSEAASANALAQANIYTDTQIPTAGGAPDVYNDGTLATGSPFGNIDFNDINVTVGWYNASWLYRKKITIDHTKVGANLSYFTALISLTSDSDLTARARSDGYDILFTSNNGSTKLNHERTYYSAGTLLAWVKVPYVSSSVDTVIYMYYGNSGASDQQNAEGAWDSSHKAVWHFQNSLLDSTSNNNDGTNDGSTDTPSGKIGRARSFDGFNDRVSLGTGAIINPLEPFTISAWIYVDTTPAINRHYAIFSKANAGSDLNALGFFVGQYAPSDRYLVLATNNGSWTDHVSTSQVPLTTWTHVAIVVERASYTFYINSSQVGTGTYTPPSSNASLAQYIGDSQNVHFYDGGIDELRLSDVARSSGWVTTSYNNQNSPGTFYSLSSEESDQDFVAIKRDISIFGTYFTTANSLGESSTTGSTWLDKVTVQARDLPAGKYRIGWYAGLRMDEGFGSNFAESRIYVNRTDERSYVSIEPQDNNNYYPFMGMAYQDVTLESNRIRVDLQWRVNGTGTAYIRNARLEIWRVS